MLNLPFLGRKLAAFAVVSLSLAHCMLAQLADTIWEGDLSISNMSFQQIEEGVLKYPLLQGGKITVPVEIWFWGSGEVWLMFNNGRWGLTDREKNQIWVPQHPGSSRWDYTSTYSYNSVTKKGSLGGRSTRLVKSAWYYEGYYLAWSASFSIAGNRMTASKMVLTTDSLVKVLESSADPKNSPTGIKFTKMPTFGPSLALQKTVRKPSQAVEGIDWD